MAQVEVEVPGPNPRYFGIWTQDRDGVLRLIARAGALIDVDDSPVVDSRQINTIHGGFDFNELGQLAFSSMFSDGSCGIFVSNLVATLPPIPGDNGDGKVDAANFVVWRKNDGTQAGYDVWRAHFGQSGGSGSGASADSTVPEPEALVTLLVAILMMISPRRTIVS